MDTVQDPPKWSRSPIGGYLEQLNCLGISRITMIHFAKNLKKSNELGHLGRFVSHELTTGYGEIFETARKFGKRGISKKGSPGQKRLLNRCQDGIYEERSCVACPGL